jgi:hypothetical protein
LVLLLT